MKRIIYHRRTHVLEFLTSDGDPVYVAVNMYQYSECYHNNNSCCIKVHYRGSFSGFVLAYDDIEQYIHDVNHLRDVLHDNHMKADDLDIDWTYDLDVPPWRQNLNQKQNQ